MDANIITLKQTIDSLTAGNSGDQKAIRENIQKIEEQSKTITALKERLAEASAALLGNKETIALLNQQLNEAPKQKGTHLSTP